MAVVHNGPDTVVGGRKLKYGVIDTATSPDTELVAAVAGRKIRVHQVILVNGNTATNTVRFEASAGGTALTGQMILGANGGFTLPFSEPGWFETVAGQALSLELGTGQTVDGSFSYTEV